MKTPHEWTPDEVESHDKWLQTPEAKTVLQELANQIEARNKALKAQAHEELHREMGENFPCDCGLF